MTSVILPALPVPDRKTPPEPRVQIVVNVQAEVLNPEVARRKANGWLLEHAGNLLGAEQPELVLGERLLWRFSVILGLPHLDRPGTGERHPIGQILLDAVTGAVEQPEALAEALQAHASSAH